MAAHIGVVAVVVEELLTYILVSLVRGYHKMRVFANLESSVPRRAELLRCHDQFGCHDEPTDSGTYEGNSAGS